jgi:PhnB protein
MAMTRTKTAAKAKPANSAPASAKSTETSPANADPAQCPGQSPVRGGVIAYLQVDGAVAASELYKKAFGAEEAGRQPVDEQGRTMHVHLYINDGSLMLSDPYPEHGYPSVKPQGFDLMLRVDDIDRWFNRAAEAGLEVVMPVQDMFWGDLYGVLRDRFGVRWSFTQPIRK